MSFAKVSAARVTDLATRIERRAKEGMEDIKSRTKMSIDNRAEELQSRPWPFRKTRDKAIEIATRDRDGIWDIDYIRIQKHRRDMERACSLMRLADLASNGVVIIDLYDADFLGLPVDRN